MGSTKTKAVAFGIKEREGKVKPFQVPSPTTAHVTPHVIGNVALGSDSCAEGSQAYDALRGFYVVGRINHSAKEYSRNGISTNQIEGFWSRVKQDLHRNPPLVEPEAYPALPEWLMPFVRT